MQYNPELYNIQVSVKTEFLASESDIKANKYFFIYHITIRNKGKLAAKLLRRHWHITNGDGKIEEVEGEGVVGQQPYIVPDGDYKYSSAAVINTPVGTMHGSYQMISDDGTIFTTLISAFTLAIPGILN